MRGDEFARRIDELTKEAIAEAGAEIDRAFDEWFAALASDQKDGGSCRNCASTGWVCENHPDRPWAGLTSSVISCGCGAGMPCGACNLEMAAAGIVDREVKKSIAMPETEVVQVTQGRIEALETVLSEILSAQAVRPYRGWSITKLNAAVDSARELLGLPSIRDLNPDIAAMQDHARANRDAIRRAALGSAKESGE